MSPQHFSHSVLIFLGCSFALVFFCSCASPNYRSWERIYANASQTIVPLFSFGDKNYYLGNIKKVPRFEAEQICKDIHMDLMYCVKYLLRFTDNDNGYWSAGTRLIDGKTWIWLSNGERMNYTSWKPGRPVGTLNRCVYLIQKKNGGLHWFDQACEIKYYFICERCKDKTNEGTNSSTSGLPVTYVDGQRYLISTTKVNYYQASELCHGYGMELLSITDKNKTDVAIKLLENSTSINFYDYYWTSGNQMSDSKTWTWSNGDPITYFNWAAGEPNNKLFDEHCLDIYRNGEWNDANCEEDQYFICEDPQSCCG